MDSERHGQRAEEREGWLGLGRGWGHDGEVGVQAAETRCAKGGRKNNGGERAAPAEARRRPLCGRGLGGPKTVWFLPYYRAHYDILLNKV